jgi:3-oxoacyl-[acyl-carrier protein] reductase
MSGNGVVLSLEGKVALVTGGSRGIGAATVRLMVRAGASVVFNYQRAADAANALVEELGAQNVVAMQADLGSPEPAEMLVATAVKHFGRLDILVANHGVWPPVNVPIDRMTDAQWRETLSTDLDSVFALVKHAVAQMKRQAQNEGEGSSGQHSGEAGCIVLVSSTAGQRGEAYHCDYAAAKGALISMTKGLSTELAPHRIRINCVAPGWVHTDMTVPVLEDPRSRAAIYGAIPMQRVANPEEIAGPIVFLCSRYAGFVNGEIFNVNGGAVLVG